MLHDATKSHIRSLSDAELLRYVLTGRRVYDPEPLEFAQAELERRAVPEERLALFRPAILAELAAMDAAAEPDPTRPEAPAAVVCQRCGIEAPLAHRLFLQSVAHERTRYAGEFCKRCGYRLFLKSTVTTLFLGWLDHFAFLIVPAYVLHNLMQVLANIPLKSVPRDKSPPALDEQALAAIAPHLEKIASRMLAGDETGAVARDIAAQAGLTPGQVWRYLQTTAKNQLPARPRDERSEIRI